VRADVDVIADKRVVHHLRPDREFLQARFLFSKQWHARARRATRVTPVSNHYLDYGRTLPTRTCTGNFALVEVMREAVVKSKIKASPEDGLLTGKVVHLALPVRWSLVGQERRGPAEMACTYDIHPHGARLLSASPVNVGDLVMV